jgi:MFS family permease
MVADGARGEVESGYAWMRLLAALLISTIGGGAMYGMGVMLPPIQAEFGVTRAAASLPYTVTFIGFAIGGILMGRLADRFGVFVPVVCGTLAVCAGFVLASRAGTLVQFCVLHALIGAGSSASFAPLVADTSLWFHRNRGIAVALCASGNYAAGVVWPPVLQHFIDAAGWRATYVGVGLAMALCILALSPMLRRRPPAIDDAAATARRKNIPPISLAPGPLFALLAVAGVGCCVAMAMPQVHLVSYCVDLGYGAAQGATMLSVMLACGIVSRLVFGSIADRIGGLRTLLASSILQGVALFLFLPFDGLVSLYVVSGLFGLFQGGLIPTYVIIIREYFKPREAAYLASTIITATLGGMALGGWLGGFLFDLTGSYRAGFLNAIGWNLLNLTIVSWLLLRGGTPDRSERPLRA